MIFALMEKDTILILSGGLDSTTLLYDEQERIALAVSFDYGSKHNAREIPFAKMHCGKCGTCVERREALAEAGVEDRTEYED